MMPQLVVAAALAAAVAAAAVVVELVKVLKRTRFRGDISEKNV